MGNERIEMKIRILINEGEYRLSKAGVMDAKVDAEELFCFLMKWDKVLLFLRKEEEAEKETEEKYFELIEKRASRIPLQHITGVQEFMGFEFRVSPKVLIPRQDTETLVTEAAQIIMHATNDFYENQKKGTFLQRLRSKPEFEVLDLCCGSGAIAISMAKICEEAQLTAVDISRPALQLAVKNAESLRVGVDFVQGDMFEALTEGDRIKERSGKGKGSRARKFDMIVSNPPYIKSTSIALLQDEVKLHEPVEALDGGKDGLDFYRIIISEADKWLKNKGWLLMEIGYDQGEIIRKMIMDSGKYTTAEIIKDVPGKDRVVKCRKL